MKILPMQLEIGEEKFIKLFKQTKKVYIFINYNHVCLERKKKFKSPRKFLNRQRLQLGNVPSGPVSNQYIIIGPENRLPIKTNYQKNKNSDVFLLLRENFKDAKSIDSKKSIRLAKLFGVENEKNNQTINK